MINIMFWDTTLRDGEQAPGFALSSNQKVKVARSLDEIGVTTIEAGFPANQEHDYNSVNAVAKTVENSEVAAFARAVENDIDLAARALEPAKHPVILTFTPASDAKLASIGWTREQGLEAGVKAVEHAKRFVEDVSFGTEFSTRADKDYLVRLFNEVISAGAKRIIIADTTGYMLSNQFGSLVKEVKERVNGDYTLSVHCHNDLGLAVANSLSAIQNGATEVQVTANGIGERCGNTSLETLAHALYLHGERLGVSADVNYKAMVENVRSIAEVFEVPVHSFQPVVGENAFATAAGTHIRAAELYLEVNPQEVYGIEGETFPGPHSGPHTSGAKKENPKDQE